jgi:hypothetical protein
MLYIGLCRGWLYGEYYSLQSAISEMADCVFVKREDKWPVAFASLPVLTETTRRAFRTFCDMISDFLRLAEEHRAAIFEFGKLPVCGSDVMFV